MVRSLRFLFALLAGGAFYSLHAAAPATAEPFPRALETYAAPAGASAWEIVQARAAAEPFNVVATGIFILAVLHTFAAGKIRHWAHVVEERHAAALQARKGSRRTDNDGDGQPDEVSFGGQVLHFFGEVEAIFGIWVVALLGAVFWFKGVDTAVHYVSHTVNFTERFEVRAADVLNGRYVDGFVPLMRFQAERARHFYREAFAALPATACRAQRPGLIMAAIYAALLDEIEDDGFQVLRHRVALTPVRKLWIAWRTWMSARPPRVRGRD